MGAAIKETGGIGCFGHWTTELFKPWDDRPVGLDGVWCATRVCFLFVFFLPT